MQAAVFGWVPVVLWVLIGGIFFGAVHDFGALFRLHPPQGSVPRRSGRH
ncbi:MAG: carbon starvation CstA family protein [Vescimonas sp.]